ncbi:MAG: hypothetical protein AAFN43_01715 [Pseudomonadota bacterium]
MSVVLKFPLERVSRTNLSTIPGQQAAILMFEGIRYCKEPTVLEQANTAEPGPPSNQEPAGL